MSEIILHHYPQSPVSEKVRVGLGIKGLAWRSVEIPRLPPKPDLVPLTGGYRRTPVMQIGADVYCDSLAILRELERRFPEPSFEPAGGAAGLAWGFSRWTDGEFLASGRPVVVNPGLVDAAGLVEANGCGVVFGSSGPCNIVEAVDRIESCLNDPKMPERCRGLAETHFNLDTGVKDLVRTYRLVHTRS